ncbi:UNVERIFIED_CONTAM: hypothetical protein RKD50_006090 [Streptomyces canus]
MSGRRRWCGYRCAGCGRRVLDRRGGGPGARHAVRRGAGGVGDVRRLGMVRDGLSRRLADGVDRLGGPVVDGSVRRRGLRRQRSRRHRPRQREVPVRGGRHPRRREFVVPLLDGQAARRREFVVPLRVRPAERSPQLEVALVPDRRHICPRTGNPIPGSPELRVHLNPRHTSPRTAGRIPPSRKLEVTVDTRHNRPRHPILRSPQHEIAVGWCRGRRRRVALARPGNPPWPGSAPPFRLRGLPLVHALPTADRPRCAARRPTCGFNQVHAPRSRAPVSGRCWEAWARTWCGGRARRGGRRRTGPGSRTRTSG